jgi:hypothetical protein
MLSMKEIVGAWALAGLAAIVPVSVTAQSETVTVDAVLALGIEEREPVDTGSVFPADVGRVWLWTEVAGAEGQTFSHVWSHGENEWTVEVRIAANHWRTWSNKSIPPEWTGEWKVEVRDGSGTVLRTLTFTVGSGV